MTSTSNFAGARMITGELNVIKFAPTSRRVRTMTHELHVRFVAAGKHPHVCPTDQQGIVRRPIRAEGAREHPTELSLTGSQLSPQRSAIDDPTLA
jgi:hypothetical protein